MKVKFSDSQYYNDMLKTEPQSSGQYKLKEHIGQNCKYKNANRPAQAISFSGSAVSLSQKLIDTFLESGKVNKLIKVVADNEAKFKAVFALVLAGMIKPGLVLKQTGFNDKDGQMIATKNSLQAFVGYILEGTIAAGFVKKIWDLMSNNFNMMKVVEDNGTTKIGVKEASDKDVLGVAKSLLKKENTGFCAKFLNAKNAQKNVQGINKITEFIKNFKNPDHTLTEGEIGKKAGELVDNLKNNHLPIFNKNERTIKYTAKLIENMRLSKENATRAKELLDKSLRSQPWDAFESSFKNITNVATVITKAKISSILLPIVVGAIFTKNALDKNKDRNRNLDATAIALNKSKEKYKVFDKVISNEKNTDATAIALNKSKEKHKVFDKVASNDKNSEPSFKGSFINTALDGSTKAFEKLAVSRPGQGLVNWVSKISKKPSHLWSHIESFGITFYWLINTRFSKKIDPDQKLGLNVHTALVTIVSSLASLLIDGVSENLIEKAGNGYQAKIKEAAEMVKNSAKETASNTEIAKEIAQKCAKLYNSKEIAEKFSKSGILSNKKEIEKAASDLATTYSKHLGKLKSLAIFTLVVRFLVPVLTVKQSKKIKKFLLDFTKKRADKKREKQNVKSEKVA